MARDTKLFKNVDWITVTIYLLMVTFGWLNIYAANFTPDNPVFFDTAREYSKQLIWIGFAFVIIWLILMSDSKLYVAFAYVFYGITLMLLLAVLVFGREVNGSKSWFEIGSFRFQPSELTKVGTNLAIAHVMSRFAFSITKFRNLLILGLVWVLPPMFIMLSLMLVRPWYMVCFY